MEIPHFGVKSIVLLTKGYVKITTEYQSISIPVTHKYLRKFG